MDYQWGRLTHLQLGRYAEYLVKMEFVGAGFDVYSAEVDDKGIGFVLRKDETRYYDVQVKSARGLNYIFLEKNKFQLRANLLAAVVLFTEDQPPTFYLVPAITWKKPNSLFVDHDYEGRKSKPEWGLNLSKRNLPLLEEYRFDLQRQEL